MFKIIRSMIERPSYGGVKLEDARQAPGSYRSSSMTLRRLPCGQVEIGLQEYCERTGRRGRTSYTSIILSTDQACAVQAELAKSF